MMKVTVKSCVGRRIASVQEFENVTSIMEIDFGSVTGCVIYYLNPETGESDGELIHPKGKTEVTIQF